MDNEPVNDLYIEKCFARTEARVHVAVRVVEQERGLELQVNDPEFTFAITLPIVSPIEAVIPLEIESLLASPEASFSELVRDLWREVCSTKPETTANDPLRLSRRPLI